MQNKLKKSTTYARGLLVFCEALLGLSKVTLSHSLGLLDLGPQLVQVVQRDVQELLGIRARDHLILEAHSHQIKELHAWSVVGQACGRTRGRAPSGGGTVGVARGLREGRKADKHHWVNTRGVRRGERDSLPCKPEIAPCPCSTR